MYRLNRFINLLLLKGKVQMGKKQSDLAIKRIVSTAGKNQYLLLSIPERAAR
jgi:hypothetical protein